MQVGRYFSKKTVLIIICSILILAYLIVPGFVKLCNMLVRKGELRQEIKELEQSNLELEREEERLTEDPVYLEKMMREKLGVVRPKETVYRVSPGESEE